MNHWINKDTEIYCSFAKTAGNTGCQMMNTAFHYYELNKIYKSFSVKSIRDAIASVLTLNIKGFAVTMPYKIDILKYVETDDVIEDIGAANTVLNNNGQLYGYNTDYLAAKQKLKEIKPAEVYILGNGGYAKAVKYVCSGRGQLYIPNYTITRENWPKISELRNTCIYNCTPVKDINYHSSNKFIDCIVTTKTGKELANMQASHQFKLYTGLKFPIIN
ncbi:hypothetical protein CL614_03995 [archaeon]|nr:hypothetical protein [archaeon]